MTTGVPQPQGAYSAVAVHGDLAMTAGMTPRVNGELWRRGLIGDTVTDEDALTCVRISTENALRVLQDRLGTLDAVRACMRMTVYLACAPGFTDHSRIADAGSALLRQTLGKRGHPVRSAVGVSTLPGGAPVEVELTVAIDVSAS